MSECHSEAMAKRIPHMTSDQASSIFKSKISDTLPLLGFLNNEDKADVWRFWRTISSAVKIAINGKGDFIETPRRNSKAAKLSREKELEEMRLQHLDRNTISIYVPIKCSDKGFRRYRVLKLANQKKIADYLETIPIEDDESALDIAVAPNELENIDFSKLASESLTDISSREKITEQSCNGSNVMRTDDLQEATGLPLADAQREKVNSSFTVSNQTTTVKLDKVRQGKKIWPVGRPTTRSTSGAHIIRDKIPDSNVKSRSSSTISAVTISKNNENENSHLGNGDIGTDSMTFYPHVKEEISDESQDDFNITILPVEDGVMQISHKPTNSGQENLDAVHTGALQVISSENYGGIVNENSHDIVNQPSSSMVNHTPVSQYQVCVSIPNDGASDIQKLEESKDHTPQENTEITHIDNNQSFNTTVEISSEPSNQQTEEPKQEPSQSHIASRNASDIETIISALEEELKKTGSNIATISVSSAPASQVMASASSTVGEVSIPESYVDVDPSGHTVQILDGQEIVEVQQVDNVIWTSEGEVRILEPNQVFDGNSGAENVVYDTQPVEAQYDVVEYEVLADRRQKRGRKKKNKDEAGGKSDLVDRTCPMCHRVLNYASSMTAHMRIHTGARPYSCGQCDRKFTTKANRDRHEATHVGLKPFQCNQCSKSFTEKRSLKIHMRTHTGERPFACEVCGQRFTQKCTLIVHMDRHTNKKGHLCDLCGKAFRQKCQLDVHVKRHNRQAMYPCNECSTKCYTKGDLVRHMIKHTGERPFRCKLCPRAFTRKQYLADHENQHYGRKPYRCSECSATFHDMGACHRHLKKHRLEEDAENKEKSQAAVISSSDFHRILEGTQIGQVLKLDDGTNAVVKAVVSEADGSTVYHITCLGTSSGGKTTTTSTTNSSSVTDNADSASFTDNATRREETCSQ